MLRPWGCAAVSTPEGVVVDVGVRCLCLYVAACCLRRCALHAPRRAREYRGECESRVRAEYIQAASCPRALMLLLLRRVLAAVCADIHICACVFSELCYERYRSVIGVYGVSL